MKVELKKTTKILIFMIFLLFLNGCSTTYKVSFEIGDESISEEVYVKAGESVAEPEKPTIDGFTFLGWYSDSSYNTPYDFSNPVVGDIVLHANWDINDYTIGFVTYCDTIIDDVTLPYRTVLNEPNNPIKEGHTFLGWYLDEEMTLPFEFDFMPASDIELHAGWETNMNKMTFFDWNGDVLYQEDIEFGEDLTSIFIDLPVRTGYTFSNWDTEIPNRMPDSDVSFVAVYDKNQYSIDFDSNSGTIMDLIYYDYDDEITSLDSPYREGYSFSGWYTDVELNNKFNLSKMPSEDIILYAGWDINKYKLSYKDWNGEYLYHSTFLYNDNLSDVAINDPIRLGYTFMGWDIELPQYMPASDLSINAEYLVNQYTIEFNVNGGDAIEDMHIEYSAPIVFFDTPYKEGHTFIGWYLDEELTTSFDLSKMPANNVSLYARWKINEYEITFLDWDGTVLYSDNINYNENLIHIDVNNPTRLGYSFVNWDYILPDNMPAHDLVLNAQYQINQYLIVFDSNGGSFVEDYYLDYGTNISEPIEPIKEGYSFDGWYTTLDFETKYVFDVIENEEITLYAKWNINSYELIYQDEDGAVIKSVIYEYNSDLSDFILPSNPVKEGYAFTGWDMILPNNMPAHDLIITALYPFEVSISNNMITITEYVYSDSNVVIPSTLEGLTVVAIGNSAFKNANISSIVFPTTLETIGANAFEDNNLTELVFPEGLTSIGNYSFRDNSLTNVTIPASLTSIGSYAFYYNKALMTLTISEGVVNIGALSFKNANVSSIVFPTTLETIGGSAFENNNLTELIIPEALSDIGNYAFKGNSFVSVTIIGVESRFNSVWELIGFPVELKPSV